MCYHNIVSEKHITDVCRLKVQTEVPEPLCLKLVTNMTHFLQPNTTNEQIVKC